MRGARQAVVGVAAAVAAVGVVVVVVAVGLHGSSNGIALASFVPKGPAPRSRNGNRALRTGVADGKPKELNKMLGGPAPRLSNLRDWNRETRHHSPSTDPLLGCLRPGDRRWHRGPRAPGYSSPCPRPSRPCRTSKSGPPCTCAGLNRGDTVHRQKQCFANSMSGLVD